MITVSPEKELGYSKKYVCIKPDVTDTSVSRDPLDQALKYTSPNLSIQELQQRQMVRIETSSRRNQIL